MLGPLEGPAWPSWNFFEMAHSGILRRPVGVEIRRGNLMAELTLGQGFEAVGVAEASLARRGASLTSHFLYALRAKGFGKKIFFTFCAFFYFRVIL
jgi:hypothetical protein